MGPFVDGRTCVSHLILSLLSSKSSVGDARIVLGDVSGNFCRLTTDHNALNPSEVNRIEQSGGFFFRNRVLGVLAITRSMGDHALKNFVIAEPYVHQITVEDRENAFVIIACDGLWDVCTDHQAVDLVRGFRGPRADVAKYLVDEAVRRGTCDNVTALVVYL